MSTRRSSNRQLHLAFRPRGGRRPGAGRKRVEGASHVAHRARPHLSRHTPVHATVKLSKGLPSLRAQTVFKRVRALLARASSSSCRICQWSVQVDHLHLIIEATDRDALSAAMRNFNGQLARTINGIARRRGPVLRERYHDRQLKTPREAHHALKYLLHNGHKHGATTAPLDPMSSAPMFTGWAIAGIKPVARDATIREPRTWLLRIGWRRHGLIAMARTLT